MEGEFSFPWHSCLLFLVQHNNQILTASSGEDLFQISPEPLSKTAMEMVNQKAGSRIVALLWGKQNVLKYVASFSSSPTSTIVATCIDELTYIIVNKESNYLRPRVRLKLRTTSLVTETGILGTLECSSVSIVMTVGRLLWASLGKMVL